MQKRAALAKEEAESLKRKAENEKSQLNVIGDSATNNVEHVVPPDPAIKNQGDLNTNSAHVNTNVKNSEAFRTDSETPCASSETPTIVLTTPEETSETSAITETQSTEESATVSECEPSCTPISDTVADTQTEINENSISDHLNSQDGAVTCTNPQPEHNSDLQAQESNVTITHFDLSLFPKD